MNRISLTDGSNTWFDADRATKFTEDTNWDGSNHISVNTGSQWHHEVLFCTASGKFILHTWSNYQGTEDTYESISEAKAYDWLIRNGEADAVPKEETEAREVGAGSTPKRTVRISEDLWARAQEVAREEGRDVSKLIIDLLEKHLAQK